MTTENNFIHREKRFEVNELIGFDAIVSRAGDDQSLYYANLIDFSRTGGKFELPFCARFDELLKIKFDFKESDLCYVGDCRVRHMRNIGDNRWHVGCSLDPPLPEDVIAHMAKRANQERRRHPRYDIFGEGMLRRQGTQETCGAIIRNISRGGFCLCVPNEHVVGESVDFVIDDNPLSHLDEEGASPKNEQLNVGARIRWQSQNSDGYLIGCSFVDSGSYTKLVDCLTDDESGKIDKTSWLVLAAAVAALLFPIVNNYFKNNQQPAQHSLTNNMVQVAQPELQDANEIEVPGPPSSTIETPKLLSENKQPGNLDESTAVEIPPSHQAESPLPEASELTKSESPKNKLATRDLKPETENVPAKESQRMARPQFEPVGSDAQLEVTQDGIPFVLTKQPQVAEKTKTNFKEKGSSRRTKTVRPIVIESEEIPSS